MRTVGSIVLIGPVYTDKRRTPAFLFRRVKKRDGIPGVRCHGCPVSFANTPNNKNVSCRSFSSASFQVVPRTAVVPLRENIVFARRLRKPLSNPVYFFSSFFFQFTIQYKLTCANSLIINTNEELLLQFTPGNICATVFFARHVTAMCIVDPCDRRAQRDCSIGRFHRSNGLIVRSKWASSPLRLPLRSQLG